MPGKRSAQVHHLGIEPLWQHGRGEGVIVAVLDAGMHDVAGLPSPRVERIHAKGGPQHAVLREHGTFCGSVVASERSGAEGIAPAAGILSIQCVSAADGEPTLTLVKRGFERALHAGVDIISCSFVLPKVDDELRGLVRDAHLAGVLVVVAAGNDENARTDFPEKLPDTIVVSALTRQNKLMPGKHTRWTDLWALGERLDVCTKHGSHRSWVGESSGATAIVSGVLALAWSRLPVAQRRQLAGSVSDRLRTTADVLPTSQLGFSGTAWCLNPTRFVASF